MDDFLERQYQAVLAEKAMQQNSILFLPTGSGKTFISIMVLKKMFHLLEPEYYSGGKRAMFLVNTVALVDQQAKVLERHLLLDKVGRYSGDMNLDMWNISTWNEEFCKFQVMVMTAEILNQLLLKKYISLTNIALIILDECHHAVEDHPMRQIMRLFEDCPLSDQPKIIGLTATLLNATPKSLPRVTEEVKKLEVTLHSTVATVNDWEMVQQFSTNPREMFKSFPYDLDMILQNFIDKKVNDAYEYTKNFSFVTKDTIQTSRIEGFVPFYTKKANDIPTLLRQISKQLGWLGPYGCFKTLQAVYVTLILQQQKMEDSKSVAMINSIICLLISLSRSLLSHMKENKLPEAVKAMRYSSSKVHALVNVLRSHDEQCRNGPEQMQALIFVEERMTAKILCSVLKNIAQHPDYSFIKAGFMVGGTYNPFNETWEGAFNKHINDEIVERFRNHDINVLVCTDVLEEGIDIPACNLVVRFDLAKSFRSYVQSKGRARHDSSLFCLMVDAQEYSKYREKIYFFQKVYYCLEELLVGQTDTREAPTQRELDDLYDSEIEPYYTPLGSKVTMTSSISLLNNYCLSFAHDRFCNVSPSWHKKKIGALTQVAIQLPKLCPMQDVVKGTPMSTLKLAKRAAALEICKRLHQVGELNDNLLPNTKCLEESDMNDLLPLWEAEEKDSSAKTGTHKKTRSYQMKTPMCMENCKPSEKVYVHHLEIDPAYDPPKSDQRKTVIHKAFKEQRSFAIISSKPMSQVCQFPVFSKFGPINVKINNNTTCTTLSKHDLFLIVNYHYNLFTTIIPIAKSYFGFSNDSYLVAPTKFDTEGSVSLDWNAMEGETNSNSGNLEKCIVTPIHRGVSVLHEAYFVTRVCHELTSRSKFPALPYSTYEDYFQKRYGFKICQPTLPLIEVQPMKTISNDLIPRYGKVESSSSDSIHFPNEACKIVASDGCLFLKAILLPSILHRLQRMLLAEDLRQVICIGTKIGEENFSCGDCSLWKTTYSTMCPKEEVHEVVEEMAQVAITSPVKKRKIVSKPWGDMEEPVDIEHCFDSVTLGDIKKYGEFSKRKTSSTNSPFRKSLRSAECNLPPLHQGEGIIKLLHGNRNSPHACTILEAITAASADDFWNLERLETLGDSFLKFVVSFMLFCRFPDLSEGKLTTVKGQILGNRNLFYCAKAKDLGQYLQVRKMVPSEGWTPPSFGVPAVIFTENLSNHAKRLVLSREEQYNNFVKDSSLEELKSKVPSPASLLTISEETLQTSQRNDQQISDKTVADSVESLIGAYLEKSGPTAAISFLEWMRVVPFDTGALLKIQTQAVSSHHSHVIMNELSKKIEQRLGYKFREVRLLSEAITHASSISASKTYERLEFVGDAVLDFLITAHIYENCGRLSPGELTDLRSALVNNITFACLSVRYGLYKFLNVGSISLMGAIDRFVKFQEDRKHVIDEEVLILLEERETRIAETVDVPKALGDVFEALIGAVFLDCGRNLSVVWKIIYRLLKTEISTFSKAVPKQIVRQLYEYVGQNNMIFRVSESTKEMQMEQTHVVLKVRLRDGDLNFDGFGVNKTQAKKSAAKLALRRIKYGVEC